ncbi:MAG: dynamin family protein, partial [Treponema sp.]|nr:dynamin family protein [Treponema sp.]
MVEVKLSYNPFEAKTTLEYKGKPEALSCFGDGKNSRLQEWLYDFFPDLKKKHNLGEGSECKVSFYGTPGDFDDLGIAREAFLRDNPGIQLDLQHLNPESKQLASRLRDLKALFERMQRESSYEELRDTKLKPRFERAVNSEFEISVIATMSSGKSTLINAILGQEVLPARNEATTAKIARIRDVDGKADFTVRGFKRNGEELVPVPPKVPATPQVLEEMNDQEKSKDIALIELEGNIPNIKSREMRLILSDTPGPNNSDDQEHAKHIDELIKDDTYKPMIMYILNATQLEINDDKELLEKIATAMGKSGKQSKDRFLFVLNKADELDPGKKECVEKAIENCKAYLKNNFEICDARIFPASAFLAKVIRKARGKLRSEGKEPGYDLTENEEDFLPKIQRFVNTEKRHLSNFSDLSPSCKKQQGVMLQDAIAKNDQAAQAEIYSGIPAIELAINEYLDKYAITTKINQAI